MQPNEYDTDRGQLAVYNWDLSDTVSVDVSSIYNVDDVIKAHNAQDYDGDVQSLVVAPDGTLTIDMQAANRSVEAPVGWAAPATTFPQFGTFVLERQ